MARRTDDGARLDRARRFTIADIILYCCVDFSSGVGQTIPASAKNLQAWYKRVAARPSASASLHPAAGQLKMRG